MNKKQSRLRQPYPGWLSWLAIAGLAAIGGVAVALLLDRQPADQAENVAQIDNTGGDSSSKATVELDAIQALLQNSLVFPDDFKSVPAFSLIDVNNSPISESILEDQWSMLFFGYTHCPDVCPVTLSVMKEVVATLQTQGSKPMQVLFITVDPKRDTADVMQRYVTFFNEQFIGVTGELGAIHKLTRSLGIVATYTADENDPNQYIVDHTASMLLVDPQRRIRAKFNAPHVAETIVNDYVSLLSHFN